MTEVRNVTWPAYETREYDAAEFPAGHRRNTGTLPPVALAFPGAGEEATGHPVAVFQRIDQARLQAPDR